MKIFTKKDESLIFVEGNSSDAIELRNLLASPKKKVVYFVVKFEDISINADRLVRCITDQRKITLTWAEYLNSINNPEYELVYDEVNFRIMIGTKSISARKFSLGGPIIRFLAESKYSQSTSDIARAIECSSEDPQATIRQAKKRINEKLGIAIITKDSNCKYQLNPAIKWAVLLEYSG